MLRYINLYWPSFIQTISHYVLSPSPYEQSVWGKSDLVQVIKDWAYHKLQLSRDSALISNPVGHSRHSRLWPYLDVFSPLKESSSVGD